LQEVGLFGAGQQSSVYLGFSAAVSCRTQKALSARYCNKSRLSRRTNCAILPGKMRRRNLSKSVRNYLAQIASMGGKARAKKYDKETLRRWAALGPKVREERRRK
jgi:hypothetical protein